MMALRGARAFPRASLLLRTLGWQATGPSGARAASGHDQLPGPYPKTLEERAAAAKKYNLTLEDYEPYPDDGMGYGDYPKLPNKSQHERSPYYDWDHSDLRRNYGQPMHWDFDMYVITRVDTSPTMWPWYKMRRFLIAFFTLMAVLIALGETFPSYRPVAPKQYPYDHKDLSSGEEPKRVKHYEI
nr:NADH dehydrogenase [ubiquinone] 1 beta subcomplex subunit 8, mitochondrial [Pogona vitticeps]